MVLFLQLGVVLPTGKLSRLPISSRKVA